MKVQITFNVTDEERLAINHSIGHEGKADRETIIAEIEGAVAQSLSNLVGDMKGEEVEDEEQ